MSSRTVKRGDVFKKDRNKRKILWFVEKIICY